MASETDEKIKSLGEMNKRREMMADGKRYLIYYTFGVGDNVATRQTESERNLPEADARNSAIEEEDINV